jgi:hypothetical protein
MHGRKFAAAGRCGGRARAAEAHRRLSENVLVSGRFNGRHQSLFRVLLFHPDFGSGFLPALAPAVSNFDL